MINVYEIELSISFKDGTPTKSVTRTEWAYKVDEALIQAVYNVHAEENIYGGPEVALITPVHIGPPADIVALQTKATLALVDRLMKNLTEAAKNSSGLNMK